MKPCGKSNTHFALKRHTGLTHHDLDLSSALAQMGQGTVLSSGNRDNVGILREKLKYQSGIVANRRQRSTDQLGA
jgi:hypothetical protein